MSYTITSGAEFFNIYTVTSEDRSSIEREPDPTIADVPEAPEDVPEPSDEPEPMQSGAVAPEPEEQP